MSKEYKITNSGTLTSSRDANGSQTTYKDGRVSREVYFGNGLTEEEMKDLKSAIAKLNKIHIR